MYRQGAAMVQNDFNSRAPTELQGYDLDDAWSLEANNDLLRRDGASLVTAVGYGCALRRYGPPGLR